MTPASFLTDITAHIKNIFSWVLKRFGKKIVNIDEYQDQTVEVRMDYPEISPDCIRERANGATFYWSEYYKPDSEQYFEIKGTTRRYFRMHNQLLWIKRQKK